VSILSVTASVDETDVLLVEPGVKADIELDAVPEATYAGVVRSIDLQPTASSRGGVSYVVRLSLDGGTSADGSPAPVPRPGMSAVARLQVRESVDVVAVPAAAVFRDETGDAVWVVTDGTVERRAVTLGAQGVDTIEVSGGLTEGETVVVRGADQVRAGQSLT
jgi:RND family efflux transporter MFP subunit